MLVSNLAVYLTLQVSNGQFHIMEKSNRIWDSDSLVASIATPEQFQRNMLHQVVCELRFPTLMDLGGPKPPKAFVDALRKEYPHLESANELMIGFGGASTQPNSSYAHIMRSAKQKWAVSLKQSALTIETTGYTNHAEFKERVLHAVDAAAKVIDSDFFTRIGLRYVNVITDGADINGDWINKSLTGPLLDGTFKGVVEYAGKLQLMTDDGGCLLQHGIRHKQQLSEDESFPDYMLDIDSYRNDVELSDTDAALDAMNVQAFNMFSWAIGPELHKYLTTSRKP